MSAPANNAFALSALTLPPYNSNTSAAAASTRLRRLRNNRCTACASAGLADVTALAVTAAGVLGALCLFWGVRHTRARFLFVRPDAFKLAGRARKQDWPVAAHQPSLGA